MLKQDSTGVTVACCLLSTGYWRRRCQRLLQLLARHVPDEPSVSGVLPTSVHAALHSLNDLSPVLTPALQEALEAELAVIQADLVAAESSAAESNKPQGGRLLRRSGKQPAKAGQPAAGSDEEDSEATVAAANVLQQGAEGEGSDSDVTEPASLPPAGRAAGFAQVLADSDDEMEEGGAQSRSRWAGACIASGAVHELRCCQCQTMHGVTLVSGAGRLQSAHLALHSTW